MSRDGAHRLDLAVAGVELLEGTAPQELRALPRGPERDVGLTQRVEVERVHALGWRVQEHALAVLLHQAYHFGAAQIVDSDVHVHRGGGHSSKSILTALPVASPPPGAAFP